MVGNLRAGWRVAAIACSALLAVLACRPAAAQTPEPLAYWQYSVGQVLVPLAGPVPEWSFTFGLGTMTEPEYPGAQRYQVTPDAIFDIRYKDIAFLSDGEGLGVNLIHGRTYRAGVALSYDLGRDIHDNNRLRTLESVNPAPEAKIFGEVFILPVVLSATLRRGLGGHNGFIGDVGAYIPLPLTHDKHVLLFLGPGVTIADAHYMNAYFGVQRSQASPQLRPFHAGAGFESAGIGATLIWLLGKNWLVEGTAAWKHLLGDAAASPVTEERNGFNLSLNLAYHF